jgi:hypothetical protein
MCRSACCPKNLTFSDETRSIYSRCFLLIDWYSWFLSHSLDLR